MAGGVLLVMVLMVLLLMTSLCEGREFLVGGKADTWNIPSSQTNSTLNQWAQTSRFRIGDTLDSVVEVTKEGFMSCNTTNPIAEYKDGNTKVVLDRSGPFYFISGAQGHCSKGQKLIVVVLTPRQRLIISPAPSPAELAVAPTSTATKPTFAMAVAATLVFGFGVFLIL